MLFAVLYSLLVAVGRPCRAFAGRHLSLPTFLVTIAGTLVGPARPTCNYPFPIPTVPTRREDGWEGRIGAPTSKGAGYGRFNRNPPYRVFLAVADQISTPPYRAAPLRAVVLVDVDVEFHPLRWCQS
jgi:hypothetical protein